MADVQDGRRAKSQGLSCCWSRIKLRTKARVPLVPHLLSCLFQPRVSHFRRCMPRIFHHAAKDAQRGGRPLAGPYFVHRHLPQVWDISVGSRTSRPGGIKSALSGSLTFHCWMTFPPANCHFSHQRICHALGWVEPF